MADRKFMPQSGAFAPYVVVNRDAAVAGVFSVDGVRGSVDLTSKYLQIVNYIADKAEIDESISNLVTSVSANTQAIGSLNTTVNTKAAKGANNDITSLTALSTAITIAQGGTGATTAAGARTALGLGSVATYNTGTSGATVPLLNGANTWSAAQAFGTNVVFNSSASFASNANNPLLIRSTNPTIKFEETDATDPTAYVMVMDGGGIRMQENDTGSTNIVFNYSGATKGLTLPAFRTSFYGEVGQIRTTGSYAQDSILIRAISDGSCFVSYSLNNQVVYRAGLATSKAYAIYRYNADGTYNSTPFVITAPGSGLGSQFNERLDVFGGPLVVTQDGAAVFAKNSTTGNAVYMVGVENSGASVWYVGRGSNGSNNVAFHNYIAGNRISLEPAMIKLDGNEVQTSHNLTVGGTTVTATGGSGTNNTHFWLRNTSGRSRGVIYAADANILSIRSDNGATGAQGQGMSINGNTGEVRAVTFTNTSDERAKFWFKPVVSAVDKICMLNGMTFSMHTTLANTVRKAGLIAQEVQKVLPEAVTETNFDDVLDKNCFKVEKPLTLDYNAMSALYVEAIKELKAEIESLKAEVAELKNPTVSE